MSEKTYELAGIRLTTELIGLKPDGLPQYLMIFACPRCRSAVIKILGSFIFFRFLYFSFFSRYLLLTTFIDSAPLISSQYTGSVGLITMPSFFPPLG